ncbi:hypothetical protein [Aquimarina sp. 2304DJ70-9]|uniref:hypothetical protein n=1 Tax=Aquimarina penaris TaxID=3231044 RepID=UPI00346383B5
MYKYKLTLIGLILSAIIYVISIVLQLDLFEKIIAVLASLEEYELDEIIIPILIFFVFLFLDKRRRIKAMQMENEKLKIYKAMLSSSHHILNNFVYQMSIFKTAAEETPGFDGQVLSLYEEIIDTATHQINSLSSLDTIDESAIRTSVMGESCVIK